MFATESAYLDLMAARSALIAASDEILIAVRHHQMEPSEGEHAIDCATHMLVNYLPAVAGDG